MRITEDTAAVVAAQLTRAWVSNQSEKTVGTNTIYEQYNHFLDRLLERDKPKQKATAEIF